MVIIFYMIEGKIGHFTLGVDSITQKIEQGTVNGIFAIQAIREGRLSQELEVAFLDYFVLANSDPLDLSFQQRRRFTGLRGLLSREFKTTTFEVFNEWYRSKTDWSVPINPSHAA